MKILFIGDSIIAGKVGVNWIKKLSLKHPHWEIENAGVNGETISLVGERLITHLRESPRYALVIIQGGTNDLLIPALPSKGFLYLQAARHLVRKGFNPIVDARYFEKKLRLIIARARLQSNARIILTTIASLNESPESWINKQRETLNEVIRFVAHEAKCGLADPGIAFDQYLRQRNTRDYMLSNFFSSTWTDPWNCRMGNADQLSRERRLYLTIDGVHLNSKGATIYREEMEKAIAINSRF